MRQVKLNEKESHLLGTLELQGAATIAELAKQTGMRTNVVQYCLKKWKDRGLISRKRPMIDLHGLGYTHHTIYFSLAARDRETSEKFIEAIQKSPFVTWIFEVAGRHQYAVSITVLHTSEVTEFLSFLGSKTGDAIVEKSVCTQLDFEYYGRRYLLNQKSKKSIPGWSFAFPVKKHDIDALDEQILDALANKEASTIRELGQALGVPSATLDRRKRALEERGVIPGYFYWINSTALGRNTYIYRITARGIRTSFKKKLLEFAQSKLDVLYFIECLGAWDFELGVELESAQAVSAFTQLLYKTLGQDVVSAEPIPVLRYLSVKSFPKTS